MTERFQLLQGDCREQMKTLEGASVDSIVTDPPYELGFMGKGWDRSGIAYDVSVWRECLRVLKPGGYLLAFGGSRTYHRLACAIEDAGFEIRDQIQWIYGCLSDDTEILINGQWEPYHKAVKGSRALCYNMDHDTFEWQPVQELLVYQYGDTAYRIESDSTDQIVSRNHRCIVEQSGAYAFRTAEEVAQERQARVPVLENVSAVLNALSVLDQRASHSEQDMLSAMYGESDLYRQDGENKTSFGTEGAGDYLRGLSRQEVEAGRVASQDRNTNVLTPLQRKATGRHANEKQVRQNRNEVSGVRDERRQESGVERRGHLLSETRELQTDQVRAMPARISSDGPQRRICDGAQVVSGPSHRSVSTSTGGGPSRRSRSRQQSIDELPFIRVEPRSQAVRASRFTRSDLARITPFHYQGVVWCVRVPSGAFVARRNGKVFITGNSGFPKSLDVSKAIDAAAGAEREVVGQRTDGRYARGFSENAKRATGSQWKDNQGFVGEMGIITSPATEAAKQWNGWGTALKPAHEPLVLARKPLIGTVAENVLQHGTGALNVNACRIPSVTGQRPDIMRAWENGKHLCNMCADTASDPLKFGAQATRECSVHAPANRPANERGQITLHGISKTDTGCLDGTRAEGTSTSLNTDEFGSLLTGKYQPDTKFITETKIEGITILITCSLCSKPITCPTTNGSTTPARNRLQQEQGSNANAPHEGEQSGRAVDFGGEWYRSEEHSLGRWPSNVIHDGSDEVLAGFPETTSGNWNGNRNTPKTKNAFGSYESYDEKGWLGDSGSAARFFYCAKASQEDRDDGLENLPLHNTSVGDQRPSGSMAQRIHKGEGRPDTLGRNNHPTVKPTDLMRYLCRLITPPGGLVLDPFCGSGSTGKAAMLERLKFIGIELSAKYVRLAQLRIEAVTKQGVLFA